MQAFIAAHALKAPASYGPARELLDEVVHALTDHSNAQETGGRMQKASVVKVRTVGRKVGAGQAMKNELRKGRDAVDVLDVVVREAFAKDSKALGDWENAKKVHASTARKSVAAGSGARSRRGMML